MKVLIIQVCHSPKGGGAEFIANKLATNLSTKEFINKGVFFKNENKIKLDNNQIVLGKE